MTDEVSQVRARRNGGNAKHVKVTTAEQWAEAVPGVLERFKRDMAVRYASGDNDSEG